jgi:hypothetical protein
VQVEGHEVVDIGLNGLQALLVVEGMVDGRDGRDQVGLMWAKCYYNCTNSTIHLFLR